MRAFEFNCPTKIVCGNGALHKLPDELRDRKVTHPLVVTGPSLMKLGIARQVTAPLEEEGIEYDLFADVPPDSSLEAVDQVTHCYVQRGCDGLVAMGGGSVIDTVKGAGACISNGSVDFADLQGSEILRESLPPFIAVPTTAGTGSEVTLVAVVADTAANTKLSYTSYHLVPHAAFLDPALTVSLPAKLTATTGMDALTHAVEAYTSVQKNPISDALARGAIELVVGNLDSACQHPDDRDARANLALASLMAGAAFSNAMVGIVHAIGHSLGGLCHIAHGQAMMLLLPHCVRFNNDHGYHAGLYGELLPCLTGSRRSDALATPAARDRAFEQALFAMNKHFNAIYGVPVTLSDLGVDRKKFPAVARQARYDGAALYNEQEITEEIVEQILEEAY